MTPHEILEALIRIRPDYRAYWDDDGNLFRDEDGTFTGCGVFTEFGHFFQEQHTKMKKEELVALGAFIALAESDEFLADAAYTCFLENIAGDPPDDTLAPYLSPAATKFIDGWRPQKKRPIQSITDNDRAAPGRV